MNEEKPMDERIEDWIEWFDHKENLLARSFFRLVLKGYNQKWTHQSMTISIKDHLDQYKGIPIDPNSLFTLLYHPLHPVRNIIEFHN